jgi:hypothetical protein
LSAAVVVVVHGLALVVALVVFVTLIQSMFLVFRRYQSQLAQVEVDRFGSALPVPVLVQMVVTQFFQVNGLLGEEKEPGIQVGQLSAMP